MNPVEREAAYLHSKSHMSGAAEIKVGLVGGTGGGVCPIAQRDGESSSNSCLGTVLLEWRAQASKGDKLVRL